MTVSYRTLERDRPRLTGRAALLLLIVTMLAVYATVPLRQYLDQRAETDRLEAEVSDLEAANADLLADIAQLRDPVYLERLARECLWMVKPGEIGLVLAPGSPGRPPPAC
jgi:cell division protein FtsB